MLTAYKGVSVWVGWVDARSFQPSIARFSSVFFLSFCVLSHLMLLSERKKNNQRRRPTNSYFSLNSSLLHKLNLSGSQNTVMLGTPLNWLTP